MGNPYGLGRIFNPDDRDLQHLMAPLLPPPSVPLPVSKLWAFDGDPLNQGATGTCVGHGWEHFLHCEPVVTQDIEDDAIGIYKASRTLSGLDPNDLGAGSDVRAGAQVVSSRGQLSEYLWSFNAREVAEWILTQGPVVMGTRYYDSMFSPDPSGLISISKTATVRGGHCYLLRGADTQHGTFTGTNSWGPGWGKGGHFTISFEDIERLVHEDGEACTAVQVELVKKSVTVVKTQAPPKRARKGTKHA